MATNALDGGTGAHGRDNSDPVTPALSGEASAPADTVRGFAEGPADYRATADFLATQQRVMGELEDVFRADATRMAGLSAAWSGEAVDAAAAPVTPATVADRAAQFTSDALALAGMQRREADSTAGAAIFGDGATRARDQRLDVRKQHFGELLREVTEAGRTADVNSQVASVLGDVSGKIGAAEGTPPAAGVAEGLALFGDGAAAARANAGLAYEKMEAGLLAYGAAIADYRAAS